MEDWIYIGLVVVMLLVVNTFVSPALTGAYHGGALAQENAEYYLSRGQGDLDGDGKITAEDEVILRLTLAHQSNAHIYPNEPLYDKRWKADFDGDGYVTEKDIYLADLNNDGTIDYGDLHMLYKIILKPYVNRRFREAIRQRFDTCYLIGQETCMDGSLMRCEKIAEFYGIPGDDVGRWTVIDPGMGKRVRCANIAGVPQISERTVGETHS